MLKSGGDLNPPCGNLVQSDTHDVKIGTLFSFYKPFESRHIPMLKKQRLSRMIQLNLPKGHLRESMDPLG